MSPLAEIFVTMVYHCSPLVLLKIMFSVPIRSSASPCQLYHKSKKIASGHMIKGDFLMKISGQRYLQTSLVDANEAPKCLRQRCGSTIDRAHFCVYTYEYLGDVVPLRSSGLWYFGANSN